MTYIDNSFGVFLAVSSQLGHSDVALEELQLQEDTLVLRNICSLISTRTRNNCCMSNYELVWSSDRKVLRKTSVHMEEVPVFAWHWPSLHTSALQLAVNAPVPNDLTPVVTTT